jgi:hypothetical protein
MFNNGAPASPPVERRRRRRPTLVAVEEWKRRFR